MKAILTVLVTSLLVSGQAMASMANDDLIINCTFAKAPLFGVTIQAKMHEEILSASGPAEILIGGPRLHLPYQTTLKSWSISTRLEVGISYSAVLSDSTSISLKDIKYAPNGYEHLVGFTGTLTQNDKKTELNCSYFVD